MDPIGHTIHTVVETAMTPEIDYDVTLCIIHCDGVYALTAVRCIDDPEKPRFEVIISLEEKGRSTQGKPR